MASFAFKLGGYAAAGTSQVFVNSPGLVEISTVLDEASALILSLNGKAFSITNAGVNGGAAAVLKDSGGNDLLFQDVGIGVNWPGTQTFTATGGNLGDYLAGGKANDTIFGGGGADTLAGNDGADSLSGGDGADTLSGGAGNDSLLGGAGQDTLRGGDGNDHMDGEADPDFLNAEAGDDTLIGAAGDDTITAGAGNDLIQAGDGNDMVLGGTENDTVEGGAGLDTLSGEGGADSLVGGDGADSLSGGNDADILTGDAGADRLVGGAGNDTLVGGADNDTITGDAGSDQLDGGAGDDSLTGGADADTITGGEGADTLVGQTGDQLTGGAGDDVFSLLTGTTNTLSITDFAAGDRIRFDTEGSATIANHLLGLAGTRVGTMVRLDGAAGPTVTLGSDINGIWNVEQADGIVTLTVGNAVVAATTSTTDITPKQTAATFKVPQFDQPSTKALSPVGGILDEPVGFSVWTVVGPGTVTGGSAGTFIQGDSGAQSINAAAANDSVFGGDGDDTLVGGRDADVIGGDTGNDVLVGDAVQLVYSMPLLASTYLALNPDVAASGIDPVVHFLTFGLSEQRTSSQEVGLIFDSALYLSLHPDVAKAGVNPLQHFLEFGWREGRDPSRAFDTSEYMRLNPDVASAGVNPLLHYFQNGQREGRQATLVTGPDTFLFTNGSGSDRVLDFRPTEDKISVSVGINGTTIASTTDLLARLTVSGSDTLLDLGGGNSVVLVGVLPSQLTTANFSLG